MKYLLTFFGLVCLVVASEAGTYSVKVDDVLLLWATAEANVSRAPTDQWTPEAYLQAAVIDPWTKSQQSTKATSDVSTACAKFSALTDAQKLVITQVLGGKTPCP